MFKLTNVATSRNPVHPVLGAMHIRNRDEVLNANSLDRRESCSCQIDDVNGVAASELADCRRRPSARGVESLPAAITTIAAKNIISAHVSERSGRRLQPWAAEPWAAGFNGRVELRRGRCAV